MLRPYAAMNAPEDMPQTHAARSTVCWPLRVLQSATKYANACGV